MLMAVAMVFGVARTIRIGNCNCNSAAGKVEVKVKVRYSRLMSSRSMIMATASSVHKEGTDERSSARK